MDLFNSTGMQAGYTMGMKSDGRELLVLWASDEGGIECWEHLSVSNSDLASWVRFSVDLFLDSEVKLHGELLGERPNLDDSLISVEMELLDVLAEFIASLQAAVAWFSTRTIFLGLLCSGVFDWLDLWNLLGRLFLVVESMQSAIGSPSEEGLACTGSEATTEDISLEIPVFSSLHGISFPL